MFTLRAVICASVLAVPMLLANGMASATVVNGSSGGSFSNVSGCGGDHCRINHTGNGAHTQLEWGYTNGFFGLGAKPGSTLTAVDKTWSQSSNANDVIVAELVWFNKATPSYVTADAFDALYTLGINFSSPNVSGDTEGFNLTINNIKNKSGDTLTGLQLADLANLSFT